MKELHTYRFKIKYGLWEPNETAFKNETALIVRTYQETVQDEHSINSRELKKRIGTEAERYQLIPFTPDKMTRWDVLKPTRIHRQLVYVTVTGAVEITELTIDKL